MSAGSYATMNMLVSRSARICRQRTLPVAGEVLMQVGDTVAPREEVARTLLPGAVEPLNVASALAIPPSSVPSSCLLKEGDRVDAGQVVARSAAFFGLWKKEAYAPVSGRVASVSPATGQVVFEEEPRPLAVRAYLPGTVTGVEEARGVTVEARVSIVQGVFGIGSEAFGTLVPFEEYGSQDSSKENTIIWKSGSLSLEELEQLRHDGVAGVVAGSISGAVLFAFAGSQINPAATGDEPSGLTLMITEGFGRIEMAAHIQDLLFDMSGQRVSMSGVTQVRAGVLRPEIVGPPLTDTESPKDAEMVRIVRGAHAGRLGTVDEEPLAPQRLESGIEALAYVVRLKDGRRVTVPRANTEFV